MQFVSISRRLTEKFPEAQFSEHIEAERERVRELYRDGIIRALWSRQDVGGAVMLLEANDEAHARAALDSLPFAKLGLLEVQIIALGSYPAFFPRSS